MAREPVLIAGAGPTGLLLALWLKHYDVPFRIVDRAPASAHTSRAMVVHARTLEFYRKLGIVDDIVAAGVKVERLVFYHNRVQRGTVPLASAAKGLSKFPFILSLPQDKHETILQRKLEAQGVQVERGLEVTGLLQREGRENIEVSLRAVYGGNEETYLASYVAGCDGAHSAVRTAAGIKMEGGTYDSRLFVTDVDVSHTNLMEENINMCLSNEDFAMVIPLHGTGRARLVGFVPKDLQHAEHVEFEDVLPALSRNAPLHVEKVNWFSYYRVHHLFALKFKEGNTFLLGDAAHMHSPVGGQGMNTGLGDATNLAWKLATVYNGNASVDILETYESERQGFAKTLINTTDWGFQALTSSGFLGRFLRNWLLPSILPLVIGDFVGRRMFKRTSQLELAYPDSLLTTNIGLIRSGATAGMRLPWVEDCYDGSESVDKPYDNSPGSSLECDNFRTTGRTIGWEAHIYGDTSTEMVSKDLEEKLAQEHQSISKLLFNQEASAAGLATDVLYIIRPDGYIGLTISGKTTTTDTEQMSALETYLKRWNVGASNF